MPKPTVTESPVTASREYPDGHTAEIVISIDQSPEAPLTKVLTIEQGELLARHLVYALAGYV